MSQVIIHEILHAALAAVDDPWMTQIEGAVFEPLIAEAYQAVWVKFAPPENPSFGSGYHREIGYMQVDLYLPQGEGVQDLIERAEKIRTAMDRGNTFTKDDITVCIERTPSIEEMPNVDGYVRRVVKIRFWADIFKQ